MQFINDGFWKGFLLVLHSKFSSILHSFRDSEMFLQTENNVINISSLGGAVYNSYWRNSEERIQFPTSVQK